MENRFNSNFWDRLEEKEQKQLYQLHRLLKIMSRLRDPSGCPWDRQQTHESLKPYLLEESYEVLEQLEEGNCNGLKEELGDLLLQIVFHAQIADEEGNFDIEDVAKGISDKLIRRHPHIFGDITLENSQDVLVNWEKIKQQEKKDAGIMNESSSVLDQVNACQPALMEAQEIQSKASEVGFDWDNIGGTLEKVEEEFSEVLNALENKDLAKVNEELGDLFFAVVNVARFVGCHSELALRQTNFKFRRRFRLIEEKAARNGQDLKTLPLKILDQYWDEAKREERIRKDG